MVWLRKQTIISSARTSEERLRLTNPAARSIPRIFIRGIQFRFLASKEEKAQRLGWIVYHVDAGHDAMISNPVSVSDILQNIATSS